MTEIENEILETLRDLDAKVQAMPMADPKPDLVPVFEKLDRLATQLAPAESKDLLHYLHKKSYQKALAELEGRGTENERGVC